MRFVLQQPSPIWKDFTIDDVKINIQSSQSRDVKLSHFILLEF